MKVCVGGCGHDVVCSKVASGGICHVSFVHCWVSTKVCVFLQKLERKSSPLWPSKGRNFIFSVALLSFILMTFQMFKKTQKLTPFNILRWCVFYNVRIWSVVCIGLCCTIILKEMKFKMCLLGIGQTDMMEMEKNKLFYWTVQRHAGLYYYGVCVCLDAVSMDWLWNWKTHVTVCYNCNTSILQFMFA